MNNLFKEVKRRSAKIMDTNGFDPRRTVLATDHEQICGIFKALLPEEFELYRLRDVDFCGALPKNRTSLVDEAVGRTLEVYKFMRDRKEPYAVIGEATALKVYYYEEDQPSVYCRPETTEGTCARLLAELADKSELKAILSCVLAVVPAGESGSRIWTCAGAAHGKILKEWGGTGCFALDSYFAVDKLDGRTIAQATFEEYSQYSHYGRAILHMLERFPYGY